MYLFFISLFPVSQVVADKDLKTPQVEKVCLARNFSRSSSYLHNKVHKSFMHVFFGTIMFTHSVIDKVIARLCHVKILFLNKTSVILRKH